ncbi:MULTISPECIES: hypothetical protein [Arthrospira]|jgi:hypothetical protein|uniref:CRISPR type III-B/RAMP module-associated protein Cmr5 n=1 Tax=Limnospira platensis NIES-46 TaxID=1236695 RepID=A0A5M3T7V4_LIMPL|nr:MULTISPECIES: hypothetical protein [Arthrospira]AMW30295.1 hypothetical protein AP285_22565 [Arthrospira platensis YZ]KDR58285.1 hypothetical protein APPUASWS_005870 [Arthrospira platensis str. Paraca]MBD2669277.1 hypothetical protein [Arthrospira platensis FACHB-439]MBD2711606.1 hypothetical protein [Arthrospira platensis FACHB-835]MDF2207783.1 hypothetical protein [Arthrospira platensis NCB002]MDT9184089.1 hypothetical protein [Limnospira sp. PMC 289.06]MDT9311875.1 hypothetical protein
MFLDRRIFSQEAHQALTEIQGKLSPAYHSKASGLIQGLSAYISTWGLHRLAGDAEKFLLGTAEDTTYKGEVYRHFLVRLRAFSDIDFDPTDEGSLIHLPLAKYTALNRLGMQLAKEWSFWAAAVLGEATES